MLPIAEIIAHFALSLTGTVPAKKAHYDLYHPNSTMRS